jgi:predicted nucleic acid-binding Zn ribbon protein
MPIYTAKCPKCGHVQDYMKSISNRDITPVHCNESMERVILTPILSVIDNPAFMSKYKHLYNNRN